MSTDYRQAVPDAASGLIRARSEEAVRCCAAAGPTAIYRRLDQLDQEWDVDRILAAAASGAVLGGILLGTLSSRKWFALPIVAGGFMLQHALQGGCPPMSVLRQLGVRYQSEIDQERPGAVRPPGRPAGQWAASRSQHCFAAQRRHSGHASDRQAHGERLRRDRFRPDQASKSGLSCSRRRTTRSGALQGSLCNAPGVGHHGSREVSASVHDLRTGALWKSAARTSTTRLPKPSACTTCGWWSRRIDEYWLDAGLREFCGYSTSVIACDAEIGVEQSLSADQTPDGRPGKQILAFGFSARCAGRGDSQSCRSMPDDLPDHRRVRRPGRRRGARPVPLGKHLRFFGDGYQKSKVRGRSPLLAHSGDGRRVFGRGHAASGQGGRRRQHHPAIGHAAGGAGRSPARSRGDRADWPA